MGKTLIASQIVNSTIQLSAKCDGLESTYLKKTKSAVVATEGNECVDKIVSLARFHLFGDDVFDDVCIDSDESHFYQLTRIAAEQDDATGKVYQGICLIRGVGIESDWNQGFELLVDVASKEHCHARDLALYTLAMCYIRGEFGFKKNASKGNKFLGKVVSVPAFVSAFWHKHKRVEGQNQGQGDVLLFDDFQANPNNNMVQSTATIVEGICVECGKDTNYSELIGLRCIGCKSNEIDRLFDF